MHQLISAEQNKSNKKHFIYEVTYVDIGIVFIPIGRSNQGKITKTSAITFQACRCWFMLPICYALLK